MRNLHKKGSLVRLPFLFSQHEVSDGDGMAGAGIAFDQHAGEAGIAFGGFKAAGKASQEPLQNLFLLHADHAVIRTAHPNIGLVSGSLGQHSRVGGGNVSMRAQNGGNASIKIPAKRDLL